MPKSNKSATKTAPKAEKPAGKGWKWTDTEDIAFGLIDKYPNQDPLRLRFTDLHNRITKLPLFVDDPKKSNEGILEAIQMRWYEERKDMEDELGPLEAEDEDTLDEDDYRDDEPAGEEGKVISLEDEEDDEDEDEFGDGFHEEGEEDED